KPAVGGSSPSCPARTIDRPAPRRGREPTDQTTHAAPEVGPAARARAPAPSAGHPSTPARRAPPIPQPGPGRAAEGRVANPSRGRELHDHRAHRGHVHDRAHLRLRLPVGQARALPVRLTMTTFPPDDERPGRDDETPAEERAADEVTSPDE